MDTWPAASIPDLPGQSPDTLVWDTASKARVVAASGSQATIYACGITPYDATHIGHAATYIAWDLLVRSWLDSGREVRYAQNVTDVDDPLLERAARDGDDWRALADREIARYRDDMAALRVLPPDHLIGAVEALDVIGEFTGILADRGSLYDLDGDVYGARSADPRFGSVSGFDQAMMIELSAERGGDPGRPGKKDPLDPVVWLAERPGEPHWDSRFGPGRPGWHVECTAIASRWLGITFDVQAGGSDLIFPHHEMSASHARVAHGIADGEVFARRYVHAGMVRYDGEKMSKSLGNLVFVSALRESGTDPMAIRLAILAHHYRQDWDWTDEVLDAAVQRLLRWRDAAAGPAGPGGPGGEQDEVLAAIRERLADDLDAPGAVAVVDAWADATLAGRPGGAAVSGSGLVRDAIDGLLGVRL
jgi:L-cysteine:1D-myo-inositol 2-amino-2-deoxy-alpha-D-glucopyranoside ligase